MLHYLQSSLNFSYQIIQIIGFCVRVICSSIDPTNWMVQKCYLTCEVYNTRM